VVASLFLLGALFTATEAHALPGAVTEVTLAAGDSPTDVTDGPDGNVWFTDNGNQTVGKVTPAGVVTAYDIRNNNQACGPPPAW